MLRQSIIFIYPIILILTGCIYQGKKSIPIVSDKPEIIQRPQGLPHDAVVNFKNVYRYILRPKCVSCHSGTEPDGEIDLSSYDAILNHPFYFVVVPGSPDESSLYQSILFDSMPTKGPFLSDKEKSFIENWIKAGALQ